MTEGIPCLCRFRAQGKSISEYALILALVVLVAIPAVMFLGNVLSGGTQNNADEVKAGADQLAGLLDDGGSDPFANPPPLSGGSGMSTSGVSSLPDLPPPGQTALSDNGALTLPDGSTTTSAAGTTQLVADILEGMIANGELLDGTPLNNQQKQALDKLAKELDNLAKDQEKYVFKHNGKGHWKPVEDHNNKAVNIMASDINSAFPGSGYAQIKAIMSMVTNGSDQIAAMGSHDTSNLQVIGSGSAGVSDAEVPGFTQAASDAIANGTY